MDRFAISFMNDRTAGVKERKPLTGTLEDRDDLRPPCQKSCSEEIFHRAAARASAYNIIRPVRRRVRAFKNFADMNRIGVSRNKAFKDFAKKNPDMSCIGAVFYFPCR